MDTHPNRTPMNGILGMAQLLLSEEPSQTECRSYGQTIIKSGETLLRLLNDILDLSKVEAGKLSLQTGLVSPLGILQDTEALFKGRAQEKGLNLSVEWQGDAGAYYEGDEQRLRQMLNNLVNNALKFTASGSIRLLAKPLETSGELYFSVQDTGIGIAKAQQADLFKPFSQVDNSPTRLYGGTGLGLSIVQKLAQLMGGEVGVDSDAGQGACFWFRVRLGTLDDVSSQPNSSAADAPQTVKLQGRVLVVEDNDINQAVAESQLAQLGLEVILVHNGQQAVALMQQQTQEEALPIDLVLMDIQMPILDGYQATQQIRAWESVLQRPVIPIIGFSANAFDEDFQRGLEAGMNTYLTKPLDQQKLATTLSQYLKKSPDKTPNLEPNKTSYDCQTKQSNEVAPHSSNPAEVLPMLTQLLSLLKQARFESIEQFAKCLETTKTTEIYPALLALQPQLEAYQFAEVAKGVQFALQKYPDLLKQVSK